MANDRRVLRSARLRRYHHFTFIALASYTRLLTYGRIKRTHAVSTKLFPKRVPGEPTVFSGSARVCGRRLTRGYGSKRAIFNARNPGRIAAPKQRVAAGP